MNFPTLALLFGLAWSQGPDLGELEIGALPGVEVVWEGVRLGAIPASGRLRIQQIPPGQYRLGLNQGSEPLLDQTISIAPGRQSLSLQSAAARGSGPQVAPGEEGRPDLGGPTAVAARPAPVESERGAELEPVPATPVAAGVAGDERSSHRAVTSEGPPWLVLLLLALGLVTLAIHNWKRRRNPQKLAGGAIEYVPLGSAPVGPAVVPDEEASFLEALEDRETAMEAGEQVIPRKPYRKAIDIDSRPVRDDDESGAGVP